MVALVINLLEREDRWNHIISECNGILDIKRVEAIKNEVGWIGCFRSHQKCIEIAKNNNWNTVLVIEDDCTFRDRNSFRERWKVIKKWLDEHLESWDIFLGGGNNIKKENLIEKIHIDQKEFLLKCSFSTTTHFTYYNKNMYESILQYIPRNEEYMPIDLFFYKHLKKTCLVPLFFLAIQKDDYSTIEKKVVKYNIVFLETERKLMEILKLRFIRFFQDPLGNLLFFLFRHYIFCNKHNIHILETREWFVEAIEKNIFGGLDIKNEENVHEIKIYINNIFQALPIYSSFTSKCLPKEKYFEFVSNTLQYSLGESKEYKKNFRRFFCKTPTIIGTIYIYIQNKALEYYYIHSIKNVLSRYKNKTFLLLYKKGTHHWFTFYNYFINEKFIEKEVEPLKLLEIMLSCEDGGIGSKDYLSWLVCLLSEQTDRINILPSSSYEVHLHNSNIQYMDD